MKVASLVYFYLPKYKVLRTKDVIRPTCKTLTFLRELMICFNRVTNNAYSIAYTNSEKCACGEEVQKVSKYSQSRPTIEAFKVNLLHGIEQYN